MRRRRKPLVAGEVPPVLRRRPLTPDEVAWWLDQPPLEVESRRLRLPDSATACRRWSRARHEWRAAHDPSYWWYRRRRGDD